MGVFWDNIFHQSVKKLSSITHIRIRITWELCVCVCACVHNNMYVYVRVWVFVYMCTWFYSKICCMFVIVPCTIHQRSCWKRLKQHLVPLLKYCRVTHKHSSEPVHRDLRNRSVLVELTRANSCQLTPVCVHVYVIESVSACMSCVGIEIRRRAKYAYPS